MKHYELQPDDVIMGGDEFLLAGTVTWQKVEDSVGRTVKEQMSRESNYAEKFRRSAIVISWEIVRLMHLSRVESEKPEPDMKIMSMCSENCLILSKQLASLYRA